ncbi:MAG TPA: efflux RND transporter periplasmic adaptor subunit [Bacteroidota bacterium]|nr:efflux RND transporter periplasmic adaptor subunit [Bacteroidota bacterium]
MAFDNQNADLSSLRIKRTAGSHDAGSGAQTDGPGAPRKKTLYIFSALGIIALIACVVFVSGRTSRVEVETGLVTMAYPSQANSVLTASGYIVAQRKAAVASKGTGRLEYLGVIEGDRVKKGSIIGRIESSDVEAALRQAQANLGVARAAVDQANAELDDARTNFDRQKTLIQTKSISQAEYDIAQARFKRAQAGVSSAAAGVKSAEAGVRSAEVGVENTIIRAPFDGTVLSKSADVGEVISPFGASAGSRGALVTLADMSSLEVEADVSESNIEKIHPGQPCEITLDAFPETRYRAVVHKIVPTADRAKATVLTKVRFEERDDRVLPEMRAKVSFLNKELDKAAANAPAKISVPASAVATRGDKKVVFVVRGESVAETPVVLGQLLGSGIEVKQGVASGDKVVINPPETLSDGSKITVK